MGVCITCVDKKHSETLAGNVYASSIDARINAIEKLRKSVQYHTELRDMFAARLAILQGELREIHQRLAEALA